MATLPTFEKVEDIPESFRSSYVEKDGKFVPDDSDIAGLKASQRRLLDQHKKVDAEFKQLRDALGDRSVEEVAELLKKQESSATGEGDGEKWAKKEKALRDEFAATVAPLLQDREKLKDKEYEEQVWAAAKGAGALDSDRKLVLKAAKDDYVTRDKDGKIIVVDADGDPTGEDLSTLFGGRFKKENAKLYDSTGSSGGGANGGNGSGGRSKTGSTTISATDNAAFIANLDGIAEGKVAVTQ